MITVTDGKQICEFCKKEKSEYLCNGCGIPICVKCRKFDMWGYSCGHIDTKVFCPKCYDDIDINWFGGKRPD